MRLLARSLIIPVLLPTFALAAPVRVACVGDSITAGSGTNFSEWESYPAQLQRMLGNEGFVVGNFGVSGTTLLNSGDHPYQKTPTFQAALKFRPHIVVIQLGTNDTKVQNWVHKDQFAADYRDLIGQFEALEPKPRIFLSLPPVVAGTGAYGIREEPLLEEFPLIKAVAGETGSGLIDAHSAFRNHEDLLPDRVHPNAAGAAVLARTVFAEITGKSFDGDVPATAMSTWGGEQRLDFVVNGRPAILVSPKSPAPGRPWIWRTEFFGAFPSVDLALLSKGWHVAYLNVQNLYGAPAALVAMDAFYAEVTTRHELAPKVVLEGFSRGGLYAFNWAIRNPTKVAALYVDAPVCDFKSWPAGKGKGTGSPADWQRCLKAYGLTEPQALDYKLNPIDNLAPLAKDGIPIIAVAGDADTTVPLAENIGIVEERYRGLGGEIKVIVKPGVGHHPHSLVDPAPVVDFLSEHLTAPAQK